MNTDKVLELLKPRIIIKGIWPGCIYKAGDILICVNDRIEKYVCSDHDQNFQYIQYPDLYPLVIYKLAWYEFRELEEMPEYVNYKNKVIKIDKWFFVETDIRFHTDKPFLTSGPHGCDPATAADYESYINQK